MSRVAARQCGVPHLPASLEVDQWELLVWADAYQRLGWQPFPLRITFDADGKKVPLFPNGFTWTDLRDRAFTWEETVDLFARIEDANAVAIVLDPGHIVVETDSREAADLIAGCVLPDGPRARSQGGGLHLHFRASEELTQKSVKPGAGLEFLCRQIVFMPPSLDGAYAWEVGPAGDLPELPPVLEALLRMGLSGGKLEAGGPSERRAVQERAEPAPAIGEGEWAEWEELLGETRPDGRARRKALCPLHVETRASFKVYRGKRLGRLQGHCFGCGWKGSLRQLRRALRRGDSSPYRRVGEAILSLGEELDTDLRRSLLAILTTMQGRRVDPRERVGLSYRELAALTRCEPLIFPEGGATREDGREVGVLPWRGSGVRRLLARMQALGVTVRRGRQRKPGRQGRRTEITFPAAWCAPALSARDSRAVVVASPPGPPDLQIPRGTAPAAPTPDFFRCSMVEGQASGEGEDRVPGAFQAAFPGSEVEAGGADP